MPNKTINRWIKINPKYLGDLDEHIHKEVNLQMKDKCDEKTGRITDIVKILDVIDNKIKNSSSELVFLVRFTVDVFKPEVDMVVDVTIRAIYRDGILVDIQDVQQILIPSSTYSKEYILENSTLVNDVKVITIGDKIQARITAVRYDDHKFSCLGEIV
jgi:DNA-directed RNA polymerase subunit E'/Rpb7